MLRATTACNCSSLVSPDGSAPAALTSLFFDPPEPQIIGKTQCFATFYLSAHLHLLSSDSFSSLIFFLLLFSSLILPTSAFHLSILLENVGSLTSKLPSIIACPRLNQLLLLNLHPFPYSKKSPDPKGFPMRQVT